jgi:hypothetical protein
MSISDFLSVESLGTGSDQYFMEVPSSLVDDEWVRIGEISLTSETVIIAFNDNFLTQVSADLGTYNDIELVAVIRSCVSSACFQLPSDDLRSFEVRLGHQSWRGTYDVSDGHVTVTEGTAN